LTYLFFSSSFICSARSLPALGGCDEEPFVVESLEGLEVFFSVEPGRMRGELAMITAERSYAMTSYELKIKIWDGGLVSSLLVLIRH